MRSPRRSRERRARRGTCGRREARPWWERVPPDPRSRATRGHPRRCGGLSPTTRCDVFGDRRHRRQLAHCDVVHLEVQLPPFGLRDELERRVRLFPDPLSMRLADSLERDLKYLEAHLGETEQVLVAVDAVFHVDLSERA